MRLAISTILQKKLREFRLYAGSNKRFVLSSADVGDSARRCPIAGSSRRAGEGGKDCGIRDDEPAPKRSSKSLRRRRCVCEACRIVGIRRAGRDQRVEEEGLPQEASASLPGRLEKKDGLGDQASAAFVALFPAGFFAGSLSPITQVPAFFSSSALRRSFLSLDVQKLATGQLPHSGFRALQQ